MTEALEKRFWAKVIKTDSCWIRKGGLSGIGYNAFWTGKNNEPAHRVSWRLIHGNIPDGMLVLHKCDNPPCVNPTHLYLGSNLDNANDAVMRNRFPDRSGEHNSNYKHGRTVGLEEKRRCRRATRKLL